MLMTNSLRKFTETINAVRLQIQLEALVSAPPASQAIDAWLQTHSTKYKQFNYVSQVILLYGAIERYMESIIVEYLENLVRHTAEHKDLPKTIRDNHKRRSIELLNGLMRGDQRFSSVQHIDIFDRLFKWEQLEQNATQSPSAINAHAFAQHKTIRVSTAVELLTGVGLDIAQHLKLLPMVKDYGNAKGVSINNTPLDVLFNEVDSLADDRNLVAHGNTDNIVGTTVIESWTDSVEVFCQAIDHIVLCRILALKCAQAPEITPLHVLQNRGAQLNHSVICFSLNSGSIRRGDILLRLKANEVADMSYILEIQVDSTSLSEVTGGPNVEVGVEAHFKQSLPSSGTKFKYIEEY